MLDRNDASIAQAVTQPGACVSGNNQYRFPSFLQSLSNIDSQNQHDAE